MKSRDNQHVRRSQALYDTLDKRVAKHANARLAQFGHWFVKRYPRHHFKMEMYVMGMDLIERYPRHHFKMEMYVMGMNLIELNGGTFDPGRKSIEPALLHVDGNFSHCREIWGDLVDELRKTITDVEEITRDGHWGHPDPLEVGTPRISRFKRKKGA